MRIHIRDAGIVDQRIEPAHFPLHITQQCVHGLRIRHIDTIMPIMLMGDEAFRRSRARATDDQVTLVKVVASQITSQPATGTGDEDVASSRSSLSRPDGLRCRPPGTAHL